MGGAEVQLQSLVNFKFRPLYLGKETQYQLKRTSGVPHSQSGGAGLEKSMLPLTGLETHTVQPVA
jgi:hypothetical protein